jgi:hypothetical protein
LQKKISRFSLDGIKLQIDSIDDKIFYSLQGKCYDTLGAEGLFTMTMKITFVESVLDYPNAETSDVLRIDYIKVLN